MLRPSIFRLGDIRDGPDRQPAAAPPDPLVKRAQLGLVVGLVEAEHRHQMVDRGESFDRPAGHALRRRIGGDQIRVFGLELLEARAARSNSSSRSGAL
jgi:hypothetical protein